MNQIQALRTATALVQTIAHDPILGPMKLGHIDHVALIGTLMKCAQSLEFLRQLEAGEIELDRADEPGVIQDYVVRKGSKVSYGTSWFEAWKALQ